jgi:hypothetical protein
MTYNELVQRLRMPGVDALDVICMQRAADAIVALQARVAELEHRTVPNDTYTREIARTQRAEAERDEWHNVATGAGVRLKELKADLAAALALSPVVRDALDMAHSALTYFQVTAICLTRRCSAIRRRR